MFACLGTTGADGRHIPLSLSLSSFSSSLFSNNCSKNWLIMLRQTTRIFRPNFLNKVITQYSKRNLSSSQQKLTNTSDLPYQLVAGGLILGGTTLIAYQYGLFSRTNLPSHNTGHVKEEEVTKQVTRVETLPENVPYLIIGGGTAAFAASRAIRSSDPKGRVLIITTEDHYPYMRPPLSKELWYSGADLKKRFTFKQWNGREKSIYFEHEEFYLPLEQFETAPNGGISVLKNHRVVKIDPTDRKVYLANGQIVSYQKCLIATGGKPKNLDVFANASAELQNRVVLFRTVEDFRKLHEVLPKSKSVTIVGGGLLGSELACALAEKSSRLKPNVQVNQLLPESSVLARLLPNYLSQYCTEKIQNEGVHLIPSTSVESATLDHNQVSLKLTNGQKLQTDYVVVAVGIDPNIELAANSGLEIDDVFGGYRVNAELEICSNLWVAGDASCFYDQKLGRRRVEHHDHAVVSGRLAGENMTGAAKPYWHQSMFWSDLGTDVGFEAIGIIDSTLPTFGVFAKEAQNEANGEFREPKLDDKYKKGVVFYLRNNTVVGILLWNLFNNMHIARRVLNDGVQNQDLNEVAKLFDLYPEEKQDTKEEAKTETK